MISARWNLAFGPVILLVGAAAAIVGASIAWEVRFSTHLNIYIYIYASISSIYKFWSENVGLNAQ
jgi:hypothetical protein